MRVDGHWEVFRSISAVGEAADLLNAVTVFQGRVLVSLVGHCGGDHGLQVLGSCWWPLQVPAGQFWVVIRACGHSLALPIINPLFKARFPMCRFPAMVFSCEIQAALITAV